MWLQDRCRLGYACRYVHGDLEYTTPVRNLLHKHCLCHNSKYTDAEDNRCTSPNSSGTSYEKCLFIILLYPLGVTYDIYSSFSDPIALPLVERVPHHSGQ